MQITKETNHVIALHEYLSNVLLELHQLANLVLERDSLAGSNPSNLKPGDRVALEVGLPCESCEYCLNGINLRITPTSCDEASKLRQYRSALDVCLITWGSLVVQAMYVDVKLV